VRNVVSGAWDKLDYGATCLENPQRRAHCWRQPLQ
jgi:hypothetical protein